MAHSKYDGDRRQQSHRAAVFVDYENLYRLLHDRLDRRSYPDELITEMLDSLRRELLRKYRSQISLSIAYADFSGFESSNHFIERSLYLQGAEPRFVPGTLQNNAVELQLTVDAMDLLHTRPDIETFVLLTGNRAYLPLVQQLKRYGRSVYVAAMEQPQFEDGLLYAEEPFFMSAVELLSDDTRRSVDVELTTAQTNGTAPVRPLPEFVRIEDPIALRTIEIIEEHFGQYEEVYLTPLLRKLSELLDDQLYDPKAIISELEDAHAVRLEKRRGYPYDYTVLIVETEHPDVTEVREAYFERSRLEEDEEDDFDDYALDGSLDYDEHYEDDEDDEDEDDYDSDDVFEAEDYAGIEEEDEIP